MSNVDYEAQPYRKTVAAHQKESLKSTSHFCDSSSDDRASVTSSETSIPLVHGLGLAFESTGHDLSSLLNMIGGYERAVGRAYLYQQSLGHIPFGQSDNEHNLQDYNIAYDGQDIMDQQTCPPLLSASTTPVVEQDQIPWASPVFAKGQTSWSPPHSLNQHIPTAFDDLESWQMHENSPALPSETELNDLYKSSCHSHVMKSRRSNGTEPKFLSSSIVGNVIPDQSEFAASLAETRAGTLLQNPANQSHADIETGVNASNTTKAWNKGLDDLLRTEVKTQQAAGMMPLQWTKIARRIGKRSGVQCQARWAEVLDERIRKGRWTESEDDSLRNLYRCHGGHWSKIATEMVTRTQRQCRSRWLQMNSASVV